jgi:hypothetical protein
MCRVADHVFEFPDQDIADAFPWDREAREEGQRHRVQVNGDVFAPAIDTARDTLFSVICYTRSLEWHLVTAHREKVEHYFRWRSQWGAATAYAQLVYGRTASAGEELRYWPPLNAYVEVRA